MRSLAAFVIAAAVLAAQAPEKSVRDGVFTAAQASRGSATYTVYCTMCHMDDLSGGGTFGMETAPPLRRDGFMAGRDLDNIFTLVKGSMPADNPGTLDGQAYVDVIAFILQQNGYPAGANELRPDAGSLKTIKIPNEK